MSKGKHKRKVGRPTLYNLHLARTICDKIATTHKGLITLCAENQGFPSYTNLKKWLLKHEEFRAMYTRAKMDQADFLMEQCVIIADDGKNDTYVTEKGQLKPDMEWIARSKLRVELRERIAGRLNPRKYGPKMDVTTGGDKINNAVQVVITPELVKAVKDAAERELM